MPRDGAGVFALDPGYTAVSGEVIQPSQHNPPLEDLAAGVSDSIARTGVTAVTANIPLGGFKITGLGDATLATDALNRQTGDARYRAVGQCRLTKVSANLVLSPYNGNILVINGNAETIPAAGVSLAPTSLTPDTTYFIYAYMVSTTMTLEASTTAHATDTATGVEIKSGDATRTLVGMARPITGPAFADTAAQRFVVSWFNRRTLNGSAAFTANRSVSAGTYTEANSEIRNEFLCWADEAVEAVFTGAWQASSGISFNYAGIAFDGVSPTGGVIQSSTNILLPAVAATVAPLAEGYHYATLVAKVSASSVAFIGSTDGSSLRTIIRG